MDGNEIAIVGIGGKFPGANDCDEFWRLLENGENHVKEVPKSRWNVDAFYDEDPGKPGKTYVRKAGLLQGHDEWDNKMFHISDVEAGRMDPQQRYTLECVHMALEDGGILRRDIDGSDTGVYIGIMNDDYKMATQGDSDDRSNYTITGTSQSIVANRVSYVFNLKGPSMTIDTACSSSLVAVHQGSQAIRNGDCSMAICGGVNGILYPEIFVSLSKARMLSPTGQCQAFSENADGYARGEGCGIVILKKLSEAIDQNNKIYAVVHTAINQDGRTANPITAPSMEQQKALLQTLYTNFHIDPNDIQYIEAHGTGTPKGDPIEANALGEFFSGCELKRGKFLKIGSVKTNIGHLESAAGIAGLIKVLLMIKNKSFVPSLHSLRLNPTIDFKRYGLEVSHTTEPWITDGCKYACVNSFGFGGTNCHAVLREYIAGTNESDITIQTKSNRFPIAISAEDKESVRRCIKTLIEKLPREGLALEDVSYTSTVHRDFYSYRLLFFSDSVLNVVEKLKENINSIEKLRPIARKKPKIAFVFCGVGTTYNGMCRDIFDKERKFAKVIKEIDEILLKFTNWSIHDHFKINDDWEDPFKAHIGIFACQIALATLWNSWGIKPDVIIGQSVGEVAAACIAGAISLECAVQIIYHRSFLLSKKKGGTMAVVLNLDLGHVQSACEKDGKVTVSVILSNTACVISGKQKDVEQIKKEIERHHKGSVEVKLLNVKCAYHSEEVKDESMRIEERLKDIKGRQPLIPLISTVTGKLSENGDFISASYWRKNVRQPVKFYEGILECTRQTEAEIFVEIGPKPILRTHLTTIFPKKEYVSLPSLTEFHGSDTMLSSLEKLFARGIDPNFQGMFDQRYGLIDIPKYMPNRSKILYEPEVRKRKSEGLQVDQNNHRFVKRDVMSENTYLVQINEDTTPFIFEHKVSKIIVVPGAFYVVVALEIGKDVLKTPCHELDVSIKFLRIVTLPKRAPMTLHALFHYHLRDSIKIEIMQGKDIIATSIIRKSKTDFEEYVDLKDVKRDEMEPISVDMYEILYQHGFEYGSELKILRQASRNSNSFLVDIKLSQSLATETEETRLHPAVLDGLFQTTAVLVKSEGSEMHKILPVGVQQISFLRHLEVNMIAYGERVLQTDNGDYFNLYLLTKGGSVIVKATGFWYEYIDRSRKTDFRYSTSWNLLSSLKLDDNKKEECQMVLLSDMYWTFKDQSSITTIAINDNTKVDRLIKEIGSDDMRNDVIVFLSSNFLTDETTGGDTVFNRAFSNTFTLVRILQVYIALEKEIPFFICTFCTQQTENHCCDRDMNILGSEIWGFLRCIMKEIASPQRSSMIRIVDFHSDISTDSVEGCLQTVKRLMPRKELQNNSELVVCGKNIYAYGFDVDKRYLSDLLRARENRIDVNCHVEFRTSPDSGSLFSIHQQDTSKLCKGRDHKLIKVENFVIHDPLIYPRTIRNSEFLNDNFRETFLTFEVEGRRLRSLGNQQHGDETIVVCSPMIAASVQSVPNTSLCSKSEIPYYYRGLLLETLLLLSLSDCIETVEWRKTSEILVIADQEMCREYSILHKMLAEKSRCVRKVSMDNVRCNYMQHTFPTENWQSEVLVNNDESIVNLHIVILTNLRLSDVPAVLRLSKSVRKIVSFAYLVDHNVRHALSVNAPDVEVKLVSTEQCLTKSFISKTLPTAIKFLKKNSNQIKRLRKYSSSLFTFTDVSVNEHLQAKESKLMVEKETLFRRDACYVVIGGLTGLGWEISRFLASYNAGFIASISRRIPDTATLNEMQNIEGKYKCNFKSFQADITKRQEITNAFEAIKNTFKVPLKGIFQGAGILHDALLRNMTEGALYNVMLPKVLGTWNLHLLSLNHDIDYFVMHSSVTSVIGNTGQSNYGAGNSFIDGLAHFRRQKGLCAQSINWGPLRVGMANDAKLEERLLNSGFKYLEKDEMFSCLIDALQQNFTQTAYGNFDRHILSKALTASGAKKFRTLELNNTVNLDNINEAVLGHENSFLSDLLKLPLTDRKQRIVYLVIETISNVFDDANEVHINTKLSNLNRDSMVIMSFVNQIEDKTGLRLSIPFLFSEEASVDTISENISKNLISVDAENQSDQDHNHRSEMEESVWDFERSYITPMEKYVYDMYLKNSRDPSIITVIDLWIPEILSISDIWRTILKSLHAKHIALRTFYHCEERTSGYHVRKEILENITDVDLREADIDNLSNSVQFLEENKDFHFDPEKNLPIRLFLDKTKCILRLVFNHIAIDLTSTWIIMSEMGEIGLKMNDNVNPNAVTYDSAVSDYDSSMATFYKKLRRDEKNLKQFWKNVLPFDDFNMSLSTAEVNLDPFQFRFKKVALESSKYSKLLEYLKKHNYTPFNFILTSYQVLLDWALRVRRGKSNDTIVIMTTVDLRMHFKEFRNFVMKLTNVIPFCLRQPNRGSSLKTTLDWNQKYIFQCLEKSLLPFANIAEDIPSNALRHEVVYEDLSLLSSLTASEEYSFKVKNIFVGNNNTETTLYVWDHLEENKILLELGFSTLIISDDFAESLLRQLIHIMDRMMCEPQSTFEEVFGFLTTEVDVHQQISPKSRFGNDNNAEDGTLEKTYQR